MKVRVDSDLCVGCGMCVDVCDKVFRINEMNQSEVVEQPNTSEDCDKVKECAMVCPVSAIVMDND